MKAAAIILAAGASRRLGSAKQLAIVGGQRLLERTVDTCVAAELSPVFVVLGARADEIETACRLSAAVILRNEAWECGSASSIYEGISALEGRDCDAAVLLTCDMPFVTADHLRALVALAEEKQQSAASEGEGWSGVPACFLRASFPDLLALRGDVGARKLLKDSPRIRLGNDVDVDTSEDLAKANEIA